MIGKPIARRNCTSIMADFPFYVTLCHFGWLSTVIAALPGQARIGAGPTRPNSVLARTSLANLMAVLSVGVFRGDCAD